MTVLDDAKYGFKADGTPRKRPGRPPGSRNKPRVASGRTTGGSTYSRQVVADAEPVETVEDEPIDSVLGDVDGPELAHDPESTIGASKAPSVPTSIARGRTVTAAVRKDIRGKLGFMLALPASAWAAMDPYCGAVATTIVPELSDVLVDIIVDSADLVAWFTSGGNYMKWLRLATVIQPLAVVLWQHHMSHTIGDTENEYAAGFDPQLYPATA